VTGLFTDTIAAVATAPGVGAIAVVRISGPQALEIASRLSGRPQDRFIPRRATLAPVFSSDGGVADEALYTYFAAPASYTGEDVIEISCHGGIATVREVLRAVLGAGARAAGPGEFTRRAFLNGRMDLAQAEAVNQLIRARTRTQLAAARQMLAGALSRRLEDAWDRLTAIAAAIEASIDFPEDVDEPDRAELAAALDSLVRSLGESLELARRGRLLSQGIRLAIVGRPNVGKSSLLNLLAGRPRAIVSDIPGTTRDFLEETVEIGGLPVVAIDTAGIRETEDPLEREGTRRALEALDQADVGLVVLDATQGVGPGDLEVLRAAGERAVAVWNKMDLVPVVPDAGGAPGDAVAISALTGEGLEDLQRAILCRLGAGAGYFEEALSASAHQVQLLEEACEALRGAVSSVRSARAIDLAAVEIQRARSRVAGLLGKDVTESLLDAIFGAFCIGK
jgi:tRNA modification GTPase